MTLHRVSVGGRTGVVLFLNDAWVPVACEVASRAKVLFDDGGVSLYRVRKGGPGSGHFGHEGRPGDVGGSAPGGGGVTSRVLAAINQPDGGFTYHPVTGAQPTKGFALSLHKDREKIIPVTELDLVALAAYAQANRDLLSQSNTYLGGWHNPNDGKVYLDVSTIVDTAAEAERLGRAADQLAYFDLEHGNSVTITKGLSRAATAHVQRHRPEGRAADTRRFDRTGASAHRARADTGRDRRREETLSTVKGGPGSGHFGHEGRPGQIGGSAPGEGGSATATEDRPSDDTAATTAERRARDQAKFKELKGQWARVNNDLLDYVDNADSPEAVQKLAELKAIVKEMYTLDADPGGIEGLGLPGGPRDVVIIGAGPGGLSAAINGGMEGLDTLVIDAQTQVGGQAKFSSRIENFAGFPNGVSGPKLAGNLYEQAQRCGADSQLGVRVTGLSYDPATGLKTLTLSTGQTIQSRAVILAGGLEARTLDLPGQESPSVMYMDGASLRTQSVGGNAIVIGGSNGASQAALGVAKTAAHVTVVSRSPIEKGMSAYQVNQLRSHPKITVIEGDEIAAVATNPVTKRAESVALKSGRNLPANAVGIFVGSSPATDWLPSGITRVGGRVKVDEDLQTTMPGVFAVGDIRAAGKDATTLGRVGAAVGEGQVAVRNAFQYFKNVQAKTKPKDTTSAEKPADETRAARIKRRELPRVTRLTDAVFALDEAIPFFSQTKEPPEGVQTREGTERTKGGPGSGHFGHEGRPGQIGGSAPGDGGGGMTPWTPAGGWENTGITWKQETDATSGRPIPIRVSTVEDAVPLVLDGKVVEVPDVKSVFTLIDRLAVMALDAKAKGLQAPEYDLCNVSVAGTNMFCAEFVRTPEHPKGIERIHMPQFGGKPVPGSEADKLAKNAKGEVDGSKEFMSYLRGLGMRTYAETVPAATLKASQREMIGQKVGAMVRARDFDPGKAPIFVSSDNYVVDGHHRWAAVVGRDAEDGKLGDRPMNILRINASISELLHVGSEWALRFGIQQQAGVKTQAANTGLRTAPPTQP